jgi:DNA-binding transcriptional LysR family regulator
MADHARFLCDDSEGEYLLVRSGVAIGQIAGFLCEDDIAAGRLVPVMTDHEPDPWDMYLYRPQARPGTAAPAAGVRYAGARICPVMAQAYQRQS